VNDDFSMSAASTRKAMTAAPRVAKELRAARVGASESCPARTTYISRQDIVRDGPALRSIASTACEPAACDILDASKPNKTPKVDAAIRK